MCRTGEIPGCQSVPCDDSLHEANILAEALEKYLDTCLASMAD